MNRSQRQAIISLVMVVTMGVSAIVTIPLASRYSQAQAQRVAVEHKGKPGELASTLIVRAAIPTLVAVIGSLALGALAGLAASRLLPPAEPSSRRRRR